MLSLEEVQKRLRDSFERDQYYVGGPFDSLIFDEGCIFTDPFIRVKGTAKYAKAVGELFSPSTSHADLIDFKPLDDRRFELWWRLDGVITQGGIPFKIKPYTGQTVYTTSPDTGKIIRQEETWDVSRLDVLLSVFFPSFGAPPAAPAQQLREARDAGSAVV